MPLALVLAGLIALTLAGCGGGGGGDGEERAESAPLEGWMIDYAWLYLPREPVALFDFDEMESLYEAGTVNDSTVLGIAIYRRHADVATEDEARAWALAERPEYYPEELLEVLKGQVHREGQATTFPRFVLFPEDSVLATADLDSTFVVFEQGVSGYRILDATSPPQP
jgi:hypothetical protein